VTPASVTVAALQTALSDDVAENVARVTELVREAAAGGAQVILPSELFEGRYFCRTQHEADFARAAPAAGHPTIEAMRALAKELGVVIPVSFFERAGNAAYNSMALIDADGALLGVYRKSHIPDGPGYQEKFFFRPGDTGFKVFATRFGTIGVGICWDQWFPEAARAMVLDGADLLFYPTAIGSEPEDPGLDTRAPWRRVMVGHAVANACAVTAANRIGVEGEMTFYGTSFICDARGEILAELDDRTAGVITATIDLAAQRIYRDGMGFFRDRRPELYRRLVEP
jgi:N-carbamoylputrescine amidase